MTNYTCLLCNSQNVVKNIMDIQFFWKNCKQTAENLLNKVLAFFILMSEPPNSQNSYANIHVLLLTPIYIWPGCLWQIFYISLRITLFWFFWRKKIQNILRGTSAKFEKTAKHDENQQNFLVTLTEKFSVPDYWYMLYKFTQYTWALSSSQFCHI